MKLKYLIIFTLALFGCSQEPKQDQTMIEFDVPYLTTLTDETLPKYFSVPINISSVSEVYTKDFPGKYYNITDGTYKGYTDINLRTHKGSLVIFRTELDNYYTPKEIFQKMNLVSFVDSFSKSKSGGATLYKGSLNNNQVEIRLLNIDYAFGKELDGTYNHFRVEVIK